MSAEKSRLERQLEFCLEADKEKRIMRHTLLSNGEEYENDAEHAWHAALMCVLLSEYSSEKIDVLKTVTMILIHDIIEIDSGDTYAYDEDAKKTQNERELKAADRLFNLLPEDQAKKFRALWDEFEAGETAEAKFARTMDNFQPTMLNNSTHGKEWKKNNVKLSSIVERNKITAQGSPALWDYSLNNFIMPHVKDGKIIDG